MKEKHLSINTENILPIIKKWLYSEKDIFLRELISNASDAITKRKFIEQIKKPRIDIFTDIKNQTIKISDNGIGMTQAEIEKYIAEIAFSGAEEFLKNYKSEKESDQIIGHFGLGFYSAYMVAEKVEIQTLSHQKDAKAVIWSCEGSSTYQIQKGNKKEVGTDIILHISKEKEYFQEEKLKTILLRFCPYLPYPIYLNKKHINNKDPLYLRSPSSCEEKDYLSFYRELYPTDPDPIFWIHLNVDYPFHLKGILYFPKITNSFDPSYSSIRLFCNRIFVSDSCKDILPEFLSILKGAIDSFDIPLNISRSFLQLDPTVKKLGQHISKKVTDRLLTLYQTEKEKFKTLWPDVELIVKLGILHDEKFYSRAKDFLLWQTAKKEYLTIEEYLTKNSTKNMIYYTNHQNQLLDIFNEKKIDVLLTNLHIDTPLLSHLEQKEKYKFQRIDSSIDTFLDPKREKDLLDTDGKSQREQIADFIRSILPDTEIKAKSLSSDTIPAMVLFKEEERRLRDYFSLTQKQTLPMQKPTFVINTNNRLILSAYSLREKHPSLAKDIIKHVFDLTLLTQKELAQADLGSFLTRSTQVLEKLALISTEKKDSQ